MTLEDAQRVIDTFRKEGKTDEEILYAFSMLYFNDKITLDGFDGLVNLLGYHLEDDFKKLTKEEQIKWLKGER